MGDVKWSDVRRIANDEIGYHEEGNNWTKYARDLDLIHYFNGNKQNVAWCATFTSWCIWKASNPDPKGTALAAQYQPRTDNCGCGVKYNAQYYKNKGEFYSRPEPGDVFFTNGWGHTGFVDEVNGNTFTTIEGNHNNQVDRCTRSISAMEGFGRPWYTAEDEPIPTPDKKGYDGEFPKRPARGYFQRYDKGSEVVKLQKLLEWTLPGCLPKYGCDGEIGSETLGAVKKCQAIWGTKVDGFYGANSEAKAKEYKK